MTVVVVTREQLAGVLTEHDRGASGLRVVVPTMGALHDGHASLIDLARRHAGPAGQVVVTVFVNPLQFAAGEDLARYPRTVEADVDLARRHGADVVFAPPADEVYPHGRPEVTVAAGPRGQRLEGAVRPGHFDGVLTVVCKLFGLTRPAAAVFGEKDYQQLVLVRAMVDDLDLGVDVVSAPTVREPDGLACSSRNRYVSETDRHRASGLPVALSAGAAASSGGADAVRRSVRESLHESGIDEVDYVEVVGPDLGPVDTGPARLLVAVRVGGTRLIDNAALVLGPTSPLSTRLSGSRP